MPRKTVNKKPVKSPPKTDTRKKKLMEALTESLGNISLACESCGFSRDVFYSYYDKFEDFRQHAEKCRERRLDFAEHKLDRLVEQENPTAILFLLKTIGKSRGYSERTELDLTSKGESIKPDKEFTLNIVRTVYNSDTEIKPCSIQES
jgi:hypothetical protein